MSFFVSDSIKDRIDAKKAFKESIDEKRIEPVDSKSFSAAFDSLLFDVGSICFKEDITLDIECPVDKLKYFFDEFKECESINIIASGISFESYTKRDNYFFNLLNIKKSFTRNCYFVTIIIKNK